MPNTVSKSNKSKVIIHKKQGNISGLKPNNKLSPTEVLQPAKFQKPFENLSKFEQKQLLRKMKAEYSLIVFDYFSSQNNIRVNISNFAQKAFAINLPMGKIVEIHASLIDDLEYQLILEGLHNGEYISDFRLTLINVITCLGELYRNRSSAL